MSTAGLSEPIVAISTAWEAARVGIVRASGSDLQPLLAQLGLQQPSADHPLHWTATLQVEGIRLPAVVYWFPTGRSYTGQQVLELHTSGSLPWLRAVAATLLEAGGRAAGPGEFTARAYLGGRLAADQAEGVLGLIHAGDEVEARQAARACRGEGGTALQEVADELLALVGAVEAGIDFVDEEDISFIEPDALRVRVEAVLARVEQVVRDVQVERPHVALLGPPNAGKSTLFNALLGTERAIVSPVLGTTRDVLTAERRLGTRTIVLQDTAGLGEAVDQLDATAQRCSRMLLEQADVVLWVSDGRRPLPSVPSGPVVVVRTHADQDGFDAGEGVAFDGVSGVGLGQVEQRIDQQLLQLGGGGVGRDVAVVRPHLERVLAELRSEKVGGLSNPELISLELRAAWERIIGFCEGPITERALGWIYQNFCLGK